MCPCTDCGLKRLKAQALGVSYTPSADHDPFLRASASPREQSFAMSVADAEWRRAQALIGVKDALNELRVANAQLRRARGLPA